MQELWEKCFTVLLYNTLLSLNTHTLYNHPLRSEIEQYISLNAFNSFAMSGVLTKQAVMWCQNINIKYLLYITLTPWATIQFNLNPLQNLIHQSFNSSFDLTCEVACLIKSPKNIYVFSIYVFSLTVNVNPLLPKLIPWQLACYCYRNRIMYIINVYAIMFIILYLWLQNT